MFNQILYPKDRNIYHVTNEKEKSDMMNQEGNNSSKKEDFNYFHATLTL